MWQVFLEYATDGALWVPFSLDWITLAMAESRRKTSGMAMLRHVPVSLARYGRGLAQDLWRLANEHGSVGRCVGGWWYRSRLGREVERRWYRSRLWRLFGEWWTRRRPRHNRPYHLYEMVISSDRMWFKLQAPCWSSRQAVAFMEARFNGTRYITVDGHQPVTPFRLSECSSEISNWASIVHGLPEEWDHGEYRIEQYPYSWCKTLSEGCNCHANKGRLYVVVCADYGNQEEGERKGAYKFVLTFRLPIPI